MEQSILEKARHIRLIAFDVDGVMTDGGLFYAESWEAKRFNAQDGLALRLLVESPIAVAVITGKKSECVARRMAELKIPHVFQGTKNKRETLEDLKKNLGLPWESCAFMGDDLIDLSVMKCCGLSFAPQNAVPEIKEIADWVSSKSGGFGAVRDVIELLLKAQGFWHNALQHFENQ